jgi:hypothetical protein
VKDLAAARAKDGAVTVTGIPPLMAEVLRELPETLGADQPDVVKRRLFPDPSQDAEVAAEWRRAQHPELFALLADSRRIAERDLKSLKAERGGATWRLKIPAAHVAAWIGALNAARLALGALHDVTADDMGPDREPAFDERGIAILKIDLYAWLQGTLIDAESPAD